MTLILSSVAYSAQGQGKAQKGQQATTNQKSLAEITKLAQVTLDYVQKSRPLPELSGELKKLIKEAEAATAPTDKETLSRKMSALRRRIILSHPSLDFDRLLLNRTPPPAYSHNCDQYLGRHSGKGKGITILEDWKSDHPKVTVPLEGKLPPGSTCKPKLSWDAKRVLFAFCDHSQVQTHRRYLIWEAAVDGSWVKQITGTPQDKMERLGGRQTVLIEDGDPCYLPDGDIAFVSSRLQGYGRCHNGRYTPSFYLYRSKRDGSGIRQLSFGEANETDPVVLPDGRLVFTRWDYINRNVTMFHMLWWQRPDGTHISNYYGANTVKPWMISETVPIPGTRKVVALGTGHHSFSTGTVLVIDPDKGEDGEAPVTRVTPEIGYFEVDRGRKLGVGCYSTPWPLTEDLFLVSYSPQVIPAQNRKPKNDYAIYLIDTFGGRELIYRDKAGSSFSPTPLRPTQKPTLLPSHIDPNSTKKTGILSLQDVYLTRNDPQGKMKRGEIKALRINEIIGQPACMKNNSQPNMVRHDTAKRVLGTVPVESDGSAMFEAPAGIPFQLQALDKDGMAIMTMRSFMYLQPGENRSCVGCHEKPGSSPTRKKSIAAGRAPSKIVKPSWPQYEGGFSYLKTVQPVWDRHCISCHGLEKTAGKIDLTGTLEKQRLPRGGFMQSRTGNLPRSYNVLYNLRGMLKPARFKAETHESRPRDYFSAAGKLGPLLIKGHADVKRLDDDSLQRVVSWMDLNGQAFGDYSVNRVEQRATNPVGEKALRDHIRKTLGQKLADQPYAALVNVGAPRESRILKMPLSLKAGGWGQIKGIWASTDDPGYKEMLKLITGSITPMKYRDQNGTCGRLAKGGKCECKSCWVSALTSDK